MHGLTHRVLTVPAVADAAESRRRQLLSGLACVAPLYPRPKGAPPLETPPRAGSRKVPWAAGRAVPGIQPASATLSSAAPPAGRDGMVLLLHDGDVGRAPDVTPMLAAPALHHRPCGARGFEFVRLDADGRSNPFLPVSSLRTGVRGAEQPETRDG